MKNNICYLSNEQLTSFNESLEHIIPNALGGKVKSKYLINKHWNNKLGNEIDNELIKQTPIPTLFELKRDRGENPKINGDTDDGSKYLIHNHRIATQKQKKPVKTQLENGEVKINFIKGQEVGILRKIQKECPEIDIKKLEGEIKWNSPNETITIFPENGFSLISGSKAMRAICKIATNYYVLVTNEIKEIQPIISFIKGENKGGEMLKYYYLPSKEIEYEENEISHIIHIEGNKTEKLLVAYVELFNCYNYLIILNKDYNGEDINNTYCYDLIRNEKTSKSIYLNITKEKLDNLIFPQDSDSESDFQERLKRILDIKNIPHKTKII